MPMAIIVVGFKGPIPPPFPNGKGAGRLMAVKTFRDKVLFHVGFGFSPFGETGEGFLQVYNGSLECCRLLQMLDQRMTMAKIMVGFKTDQCNALVFVGQIY